METFKSLILWLGGETKEWQSAKQFARKLNPSRCSLIRCNNKDQPGPLKAAQEERDLGPMLAAAKPVVHKWIISFSTLRQEVYDELAQAEQVAGIKVGALI